MSETRTDTLGEHELFDAAFFDALRPLRIVASRVARGGRHAEHLSRDLGAGIEFRDYRGYTPGDDLRAIDWNIYRRLGRVFVRLFEEQEDLPLYLLPDVSRSMFLEQPPRIVAGLRTAVALAAISLNQHDTVGVFPFADDLAVHERPKAGKNQLLAIARRIADVPRGERTDIVTALRRLSGMRLRRGLVAVISDFFDPAGVETVCQALGRLRHRLLLVQLVRPSDRDPRLQGVEPGRDLRLIDCESGDGENISVTERVLARYREAYDRHAQAFVDFATRRGAGFVRIDVEQDVPPQLARLFEDGVLAV